MSTGKSSASSLGLPTCALTPMRNAPVYFDVAQCLRQDGSEDFTAEDAVRLEALGYTIVWPVIQEGGRE